MTCRERSSWIVVMKGTCTYDGSRYSIVMRYCTAHALQIINGERDAVKRGEVVRSAIKVIDPFTDIAITSYPDRPEMGIRYTRTSNE